LVAVAGEPDEEKGAVVASTEARFEEADERQAAEPEVEAIDAHDDLETIPRGLACARTGWLYSAELAFRYIAIEGPIGVGKTRLAKRLAGRIDGAAVLEDADNPFLADFYNERPGSALQVQLFYLLNRHR